LKYEKQEYLIKYNYVKKVIKSTTINPCYKIINYEHQLVAVVELTNGSDLSLLYPKVVWWADVQN